MSFEEEFDRIIRQKAEEAKFTFSEENWQKASRMMDAERSSAAAVSGKKHLVYAAVGVIAIGAAIVGALYFIPSATTNPQLATIQNKNNHIQNPEQEIKSKAKESTNAINQEIVKSEGIVEVVSAKTKTQVNLTNKALGSDALSETKPDEAESVSQEKSTYVPAEANNGPTNNNLLSNGAIPNIEGSGVISDALITDIATKEGSLEASNDKAGEDQVQVESLNLHPASLVPLNIEEELITSNINFLSRYDQDYYKKDARTKTYFVDLEGGANYLMGWDVNGAQDAKGFNWFGGINFGYYLSKKFAFGLGAQLYTIQNIQQPYYMNSEKVYGFGSSLSQTIITCNSLMYASLPIKLYYELTKQSVFGFGINTGFLLSANSTVEQYNLSDNTKFNTETTHISGVYEGMKSINTMLSASFMQQISGKLSVQVEANYGLSDLFMNTSVNNGKQTSSGFRVGINYRICSK